MTEFYVKYSNYIDSSIIDEMNSLISKGSTVSSLFDSNKIGRAHV